MQGREVVDAQQVFVVGALAPDAVAARIDVEGDDRGNIRSSGAGSRSPMYAITPSTAADTSPRPTMAMLIGPSSPGAA